MDATVGFPERQIAQAIVFLRAAVKVGALGYPLSVCMVVGTQSEPIAWRKEAIDYLTAKAKGLQYSPLCMEFSEE